MKKPQIWMILATAAVSAAASTGSPASSAPTRVQEVAHEIRVEIKAVNQALAEQTPQDRNMEEICFRVGNLWLTARKELEEVSHGITNPPQEINELIADGKSLPGFCHDVEKVKSDPPTEDNIAPDDVDGLKAELGRMDARATTLE